MGSEDTGPLALRAALAAGESREDADVEVSVGDTGSGGNKLSTTFFV